MSGNAVIGSHLAAADFSNEPGAVLWRHTPPRRTESGLLSYGTASPDSSVQKTALWRTRAHLSAGAHAAVAAAQVVVQNGRRAQAEAGGDSSGAGVAEVREGEVAAEQMRRKSDAANRSDTRNGGR